MKGSPQHRFQSPSAQTVHHFRGQFAVDRFHSQRFGIQASLATSYAPVKVHHTGATPAHGQSRRRQMLVRSTDLAADRAGGWTVGRGQGSWGAGFQPRVPADRAWRNPPPLRRHYWQFFLAQGPLVGPVLGGRSHDVVRAWRFPSGASNCQAYVYDVRINTFRVGEMGGLCLLHAVAGVCHTSAW